MDPERTAAVDQMRSFKRLSYAVGADRLVLLAMITTVLFDLDGTLYDRDFLIRSLAESQYRRYQSELSHVDRAVYIERLIELDDHGYQPKKDVYVSLAREFGLTSELEQELEGHLWTDYDRHCNVSDDTARTLRALRDSGKRLGIITNEGTQRQHAKIDALGIRSLFDVVLVSQEVGLRKPDARIFHLALQQCDALASEAVFVGDNPQADIEGAINAGLGAVWKSVPYWHLTAKDIPQIDLLSEVLPLVEQAR